MALKSGTLNAKSNTKQTINPKKRGSIQPIILITGSTRLKADFKSRKKSGSSYMLKLIIKLW